MNIIILDTPRGNVTKRFRYIYLFCPFLEPLLTPLGHPSTNPLLLTIEVVSELNSYLLLLINALKDPQKEPERIRPLLYTPPKLAIIPFNPAMLPFKTRLSTHKRVGRPSKRARTDL